MCESSPDEEMPLLILDLNGTLIREHDKWGSGYVHIRPYTHVFLRRLLAKGWTLGIWSASPRWWVEKVLKKHFSTYAFLFVWTAKECVRNTKPLDRVWKLYPRFHARNTFLLDNKPRNYAATPRNGIPIRTYYRGKDEELLHLSTQLTSD